MIGLMRRACLIRHPAPARLALGIAVCWAVAWLAAPARAQAPKDPHIQQINELVKAVAGVPIAEKELFPAILEMREAPGTLRSITDASLMTPGDEGWSEAEQWAQREPNRKVLETLAAVTDSTKKTVLSIPYGTEGVPEAWVAAGLCIELGRGGTLAGMQLRYLKRLEDVAMLCNVEATRLAAGGKGKEAMQVLVDWLRLGRMVADRAMFEEKKWGAEQMILAAERMRDIAYLFPDSLTPEDIADICQIEQDERTLGVDRMTLPQGDRIAAEQLMARTFIERDGVNVPVFASTMARIGAAGRPLTRFSEGALWRDIASVHADWFDTREQIEKLMGDWNIRWNLPNLHDELLAQETDYDRMNKRTFAMVDRLLGPIQQLFALRMRVLAEIGGTRNALGVLAFKLRERQWPRVLEAIQPKYVRQIDPDPYHYYKRTETLRPFGYFVPIRDAVVGPRELPQPHRMTVFLDRRSAGLTPDSDGGEDSPDAAVNGGGDGANAPFPGLPPLPGLDPSVLTDSWDPESKQLDAAKLREVLTQSVRETPLTDEGREQARQFFQSLIDQGVTPDNVQEKMLAQLESPEGQPAAQMMKAMGVDLHQIARIMADRMRVLLEDPAFTKALEAVRSGAAPSDDDLRGALTSAIEIMLTDESVASLTQALAGVMDAFTGSMGGFAGRSFTVSIDDSQFVLFSTGPDGVSGKARSVGPGGDDLLIWPPVLSLWREHR